MKSLDSDCFWNSSETVVFRNPRVPLVEGEEPDLAHLEGMLLFRTSGASGGAKWACLTREALLASAASVNRFVGAGPQDHWLRALPDFHVGGFAIHARARAGAFQASVMEDPWDPGLLVKTCADRQVTLLSLVPTQVHDLVEGEFRCPVSLRMVMVGGAALAPSLRGKFRALGWPVRETYGMTETASQVASENATGELELLDSWEVRLEAESGVLELKGAPLFAGYLVEGAIRFPGHDGWFSTGDTVSLEKHGRTLRYLGRRSDQIKIMGEWVDLTAQAALLAAEGMLPADQFVLVDLPDARRGNRLVLVAEATIRPEILDRALDAYRERVAPFARLDEVIRVPELPRSPLGKPMRGEIKALALAHSSL